jgi:hypothetical protein
MAVDRRKKDVDIQSNLSRELSFRSELDGRANIEGVTNSGGYMQQDRTHRNSFIRVEAMRITGEYMPGRKDSNSRLITIMEAFFAYTHVGLGVVLLMCAVLLFPAARAAAQNSNAGEIRGTVTDGTGAVMPGVEVTVTDTLTGVTNTTKTNSGGVYDIPSLMVPGTYSVKFSNPSYRTLVKNNILLSVTSITINGALEVGTVSQQVTVDTSTAAQLQTDSSAQNLTLDEKTVIGLPNLGATVFNEMALIPGVNGGGGQQTNGDAVGVNGAESFQNNILLNGGTATEIGSQNEGGSIEPTDFISEVSFDSHTFSAESGNGAYMMNIITKSGSNRFHGSAFDYRQTNQLSARNYFSIGIPPGSSDQFGGTVGGPILRNKLFFFFGFDRLSSLGLATGYFTTPTAAERAGNFAGLPTIYDPSTTVSVKNPATGQTTIQRTAFQDNQIPLSDLSAQALNIQSYFPEPNLPGISNNYYYSVDSFETIYYWNGRIDYNPNNRHHLDGSYTHGTTNYPTITATAPIGEYTELGSDNADQISDTWTISPSKINEARFSLMRFSGNWVGGDLNKGYPQKIGIPNPLSNVFPGIGIGGAISTSIGAGLDADLVEDSYVPSDVFTWVKGKHILKFGGEFDDYEVNINFGGYSDGNYSFSGIATRDPSGSANASNGVGYADFLLGDVASWNVSISPETGSRLKSYQLFVQDDYKFSPSLTLNLGLRYEIQPGWTEAKNRIGDFDPNLLNPATGTLGALWFAPNDGRTSVEAAQYGLVQPRVGFSWSPRSTWAVRGGFGIYDELYGYNTYEGSAGLGYTAQNSQSSTDQITPVFNLAQGPPPPIYPTDATRTPELLNNQGISYIPYHTPVPYMEEWQLDVQHQFPGGIVADIGYVGSRGVHVALASDADQVPANLIFNAASGANMQQFRPYPQYEGIGTTTGGGTSHYDALQLIAQKRYANGLQFATTFTYSHTLDDGTGSGYGGPNGIRAANLWQNGYNPRSSYGNSLLDQPYTFNGDAIYELPVGQGKLFLNHGGILNAIIGGWVGSGLWQVHSGEPFTPYIGGANLDGSLAGTWFPNRVGTGKLAHPTIQEWFNPADFQTPAVGTYGNSGRNILFGPSWRELDLSLTKKWAIRKLGQAANVQVRIDAQDALNNPNFANPNPALGTGGVGTITGANTSRGLQFSAKFEF